MSTKVKLKGILLVFWTLNCFEEFEVFMLSRMYTFTDALEKLASCVPTQSRKQTVPVHFRHKYHVFTGSVLCYFVNFHYSNTYQLSLLIKCQGRIRPPSPQVEAPEAGKWHGLK
jgi:hypothetical protein